jgi:hypothetical protein
MKGFIRGAFTGVLCLGVVLATAPLTVQAEMIGTERMVSSQQRTDDLNTVTAFMSRADAVEQMEQLGVDPVDARARVASLSDEELSRLAQNVRDQPAGADGGLFVVLGIVFLVLIILELVGVTHIFSAI